MRAAVTGALAGLDVALPGAGRTGDRWLALHDLAVADVSVARLCEAHLDAVAILAEAGVEPCADALYGVWASVRPDGRDVALSGRGLDGVKSFCSGIGIVDRALIDAAAGDARQLVDADVRFLRHAGSWRSPTSRSSADVEWHHAGLAACNTGTVCLAEVDDVVEVGPPDWYLERVGFWHGACGPAACWAGGAAGLIPHAAPGDDPYRLAAAGEIAADAWAMRAVLQQAGDEADTSPDDADRARWRARMVRHTVHERASAVLDTFARHWGPRPLVGLPDVAQRVADVEIYLRQHNGARDSAALGKDLWRPARPEPTGKP